VYFSFVGCDGLEDLFSGGRRGLSFWMLVWFGGFCSDVEVRLTSGWLQRVSHIINWRGRRRTRAAASRETREDSKLMRIKCVVRGPSAGSD
jgi:hypothetical protein